MAESDWTSAVPRSIGIVSADDIAQLVAAQLDMTGKLLAQAANLFRTGGAA